MNILVNGDFTEGDNIWQDHSTVRIPKGWDLFNYERNAHMPECYSMMMGPPQDIGPIWKVFTTYSQHEYALGQRVRVPVGAELLASAGVWAWSSGKDNPLLSETGGSYHTRIGIDPFGGTDWRSPYVVWDYPPLGHKLMDIPDEHYLEATAEAGMITVWLHGQHEWALKHGDAYWHEASLEITSQPTPEPSGDLAALTARVAELERQLRETGTAHTDAIAQLEAQVAQIEIFLAQWTQYTWQ